MTEQKLENSNPIKNGLKAKIKPQKELCAMCDGWKNLADGHCVGCNGKLTPEAMAKFAQGVERMYNKLASFHPLKKYYGDKPFNNLSKRDQKKIIKRQREVKLGHYIDEVKN